MSVLQLGDQFVDRAKSVLYLHYLAKASEKRTERDIARRKLELSLQQLKKLSTKELHKHIDVLQGHILEAIHREKNIQSSQDDEDTAHKDLSHKIGNLEHKLGKYLETQKERKKRVEQIERKIHQRMNNKRQLLKELKQDYNKLMTLYKKAKKTNKALLPKISQRIKDVKSRISAMK